MAQDHPPASGLGYPLGGDGQDPVGYDHQHQQPWYEQPQPYVDGQQQWQWQDGGLPQQPEPEAYYQQPSYPEQYGYAPGTGYDPSAGYDYQAVSYQAAPYEPAPYEPAPYEPEPYEPESVPVEPVAVEPVAVEPEPEDDDPAPDPGKASLVDRAKAAADAVLSADHAPGKRALLIRAAAGVAALGVLVTAGIVATSSSGSAPSSAAPASADTGFAVAHDKLWSAQPAAAPQPNADDTLAGSWLLADAVVRADSGGVHAYGLADGKPTWSIEPPAAGAVPCGLSPTVNPAGLGAVLFRTQADPKSPCTLLLAVDTKTGKAVWNKSLSDTKNPYSAHVAVTADKVVAVGDDKAVAWAAADGKDAWQYTGQGKFCSLSGSAAGATVLLHSTCADSNPGDQAVALSVAEGKVLWWRGLNNQPKTVTVLSAEPAVVLTTGDKPTDDRVFAWGATGDPAAEIPVTIGDSRLNVARGTFDPVPEVFFQDHTMITTLAPGTATANATTTATAYDLTTGKALWQTPISEKGTSRAVGLDNGALVLAAEARVGQPAHLSRVALTNGQEAVGGGYPKDTGSLLTSGRILLGGGKVVAVPEHSSHFGVATGFQAKG